MAGLNRKDFSRQKIRVETSWLEKEETMTRIAILCFVLIVVAVFGLVALSNWQIPAPTTVINKVIPNDELAKYSE